MSRLCYTCGVTVEDATAVRCTRPYCAAKRDIERDAKASQGTRPPAEVHMPAVPGPWTTIIVGDEA